MVAAGSLQRRIRFVSAVTHELRTPLTTLRLYLDMLTGGLVRRGTAKDGIPANAATEAERLHRLISNVLDFARLENQRPRLEFSTVRVGAILEQLHCTWEERCRSTEKQLVIEPGSADDVLVQTDMQIIDQVLGNLIDNACKYSRGAADPRIWLRARLEVRGGLVFEVEDGGPGVSASEQRSIFRPFCRGRDADFAAGGVGLGLALARSWAALLHGRLCLGNAAKGSSAASAWSCQPGSPIRERGVPACPLAYASGYQRGSQTCERGSIMRRFRIRRAHASIRVSCRDAGKAVPAVSAGDSEPALAMLGAPLCRLPWPGRIGQGWVRFRARPRTPCCPPADRPGKCRRVAVVRSRSQGRDAAEEPSGKPPPRRDCLAQNVDRRRSAAKSVPAPAEPTTESDVARIVLAILRNSNRAHAGSRAT